MHRLFVVLVALLVLAAGCSDASSEQIAAQISAASAPSPFDDSRRVFFEFPVEADAVTDNGRWGVEQGAPVEGTAVANAAFEVTIAGSTLTGAGQSVLRDDDEYLRFEVPLPLTDYQLRITHGDRVLVDQPWRALAADAVTVSIELEVDPEDATRSRGLETRPRMTSATVAGAVRLADQPVAEVEGEDGNFGSVEHGSDQPSSGRTVTFALLDDQDQLLLRSSEQVIACDGRWVC